MKACKVEIMVDLIDLHGKPYGVTILSVDGHRIYVAGYASKKQAQAHVRRLRNALKP